MSIEKKIEDLIDALDRNTAALGAKPVAKAVAPKSDKKPAKSEDQVVAEAVAKAAAVAEAADETPSIRPEAVKGAVDGMLKANRRDDAIALLASFNGAKSASDITKQGQEVMAEFIAKAEEILLGA